MSTLAEDEVADIQSNPRFLLYLQKSLGGNGPGNRASSFGLRVEHPWRQQGIRPERGDLAHLTFVPLVEVGFNALDRYNLQVLETRMIEDGTPTFLGSTATFDPHFDDAARTGSEAGLCAAQDWRCRYLGTHRVAARRDALQH
ncbi:MAG: hypothetical protein V2I63_07825 [Pseudomonadales bacterium]|nr:hypothetical protein [Pseudomonadales bacterium]